MRVGSRYTPFCFISCKVGTVRKLPCSIESTPASTASFAARSPCACAATLRRQACASHDRLEFFGRELRHVDRIGFGKHAAGGADLDPVGAVLHLFAHRLPARFRTIADAFERA